jgi:hypothetical protein
VHEAWDEFVVFGVLVKLGSLNEGAGAVANAD